MVRRVLATGSALAAVAFAAVAGLHLVNEWAFAKPHGQLNADAEGNVLTWASGLATLACAAAALVLAGVWLERRRLLNGLAVALAFFGVDDLTGFHEDLGLVMAAVGLPNIDGIWFPVYVPLLLGTFALLWVLASGLGLSGACVRLGLLLLGLALAGEVAAAGFLPWVSRDEPGIGYAIEVAVEEGAELAAWLLIATGLTAVRVQLAAERAEAPAAVTA